MVSLTSHFPKNGGQPLSDLGKMFLAHDSIIPESFITVTAIFLKLGRLIRKVSHKIQLASI